MLCQLKSISRHLNTVHIPESERLDIIQNYLRYLGNAEKHITNPELAAELNRQIAKYHTDKELYRKEKQEFNAYMMDKYTHYSDMLKASDNPLKLAAKLAIAGNIIDFGPGHEFSVDETISQVIKSDLRIDDSARLFEDLNQAKTVLYLGDNAGEIVMDKLFIKTINHPNLVFATRGKPVLNDVVKEDADFVGMEDVCSVIDNGTDIPSTVLSQCSDEFLEIFHSADVIISKGQGNLEGLITESKRNIYFLFTVKCHAIADLTLTNKGDFVLMHASNLPKGEGLL